MGSEARLVDLQRAALAEVVEAAVAVVDHLEKSGAVWQEAAEARAELVVPAEPEAQEAQVGLVHQGLQ